ncbi:MAG: hypothetical protein JW697_06495, partial [Kosmotogaceae bacterium]|nr:hypothetical protein [Kosmotogaceae bacterium]
VIGILEDTPDETLSSESPVYELYQEIKERWKDLKDVISKESIGRFIKDGREALEIIIKATSAYTIIPTLGTYLLTNAWLTHAEEETGIAALWNRLCGSGHLEHSVAASVSSYFVKKSKEFLNNKNEKIEKEVPRFNRTRKSPFREMSYLMSSINEEEKLDYEKEYSASGCATYVGTIDIIDSWFLSELFSSKTYELEDPEKILESRKEFISRYLPELSEEIGELTYSGTDDFLLDIQSKLVPNLYSEIIGSNSAAIRRWPFALALLRDLYETSKSRPFPITDVKDETIAKRVNDYLALYSNWNSYALSWSNYGGKELLQLKKGGMIHRQIDIKDNEYRNFFLIMAANFSPDISDSTREPSRSKDQFQSLILSGAAKSLRLLRYNVKVRDSILNGTDFRAYKEMGEEFISFVKHLKETEVDKSLATTKDIFSKLRRFFIKAKAFSNRNNPENIRIDIDVKDLEYLSDKPLQRTAFEIFEKEKSAGILDDFPVLLYDFQRLKDDNVFGSYNTLFREFAHSIEEFRMLTNYSDVLSQFSNVLKLNFLNTKKIAEELQLAKEVGDFSKVREAIMKTATDIREQSLLLFKCCILEYCHKQYESRLSEVTERMNELESGNFGSYSEVEILKMTGELICDFHAKGYRKTDRVSLEDYPLYIGIEVWAHGRWVFLDRVNIWIQLPLIITFLAVFTPDFFKWGDVRISPVCLFAIIPSLIFLCWIELSIRLKGRNLIWHRESKTGVSGERDYRFLSQTIVYSIIALVIGSIIESFRTPKEVAFLNLPFIILDGVLLSNVIPVLSGFTSKPLESDRKDMPARNPGKLIMLLLSLAVVNALWFLAIYFDYLKIYAVTKTLFALDIAIVLLIIQRLLVDESKTAESALLLYGIIVSFQTVVRNGVSRLVTMLKIVVRKIVWIVRYRGDY